MTIKNNSDLDEVVDTLYRRMFRKRYSGYDKLFDNHFFTGKQANKEKIKELLLAGHDVRTGYICTQVKGSHDYFVSYIVKNK